MIQGWHFCHTCSYHAPHVAVAQTTSKAERKGAAYLHAQQQSNELGMDVVGVIKYGRHLSNNIFFIKIADVNVPLSHSQTLSPIDSEHSLPWTCMGRPITGSESTNKRLK